MKPPTFEETDAIGNPPEAEVPPAFEETQEISPPPFESTKPVLDEAHIASIQDPVGHAIQNPDDKESAYEARKRKDAQPTDWGDVALSIPGAVWGGIKGGVNFVRGLGDTSAHFAKATAATAGGMVAERMDSPQQTQDWLGNQQLTHAAETVIGAQKIEQNLKHVGHGISRFFGMGYDPLQGVDDATPEDYAVAKDKADREEFDHEIEAAKAAQPLAESRPLPTGPTAAASEFVVGTNPSVAFSPESLQAHGANPVDQAYTDRSAAAADPTTLLLPYVSKIPGVSTIAGGAAEGLGLLSQAPYGAIRMGGRLMGKAGSMSKTLAAGTVGGLVASGGDVIHHPKEAMMGALIMGGARGLSWMGEGMTASGRAMRTGLTSDLVKEAAIARLTGQAAKLNTAKRFIGDTTAAGFVVAGGFAPFNAAIAKDPKEFIESTGNAFGMGGVFGAFHSSRSQLVKAGEPYLKMRGEQSLDSNTPESRRSNEILMQIPEAQRNYALQILGALGGLPVRNAAGQQVPAQMRLQSGAEYASTINRITKAEYDAINRSDIYNPKDKTARKASRKELVTAALNRINGAKTRGIAWHDGIAYINTEASSFANPSEAAHTMGHEFGGHIVVKMLQAAGEKGGQIYEGLMSELKRGLITPKGTPTVKYKAFIDEYNRRMGSKQLDAYDPVKQEEFLAETAGKIIADGGIADAAMPKNLLDHVTDATGQFFSKFLGIDTRKTGSTTSLNIEEVGAITRAVRDSLAQLAGMNLREGKGMEHPLQNDIQRIQQLQEVLAKPRPPGTAPAIEVDEWLAEQKEARTKLAEVQKGQPPPFPAAGAPPVAPSAPQAPKAPQAARPRTPEETKIADDTKSALMVLGYKDGASIIAIREAERMHGEPIGDEESAMRAALRVIRGGGSAVVHRGEFKPGWVKPVAPIPESAAAKAEQTDRANAAKQPAQPVQNVETPEPQTGEQLSESAVSTATRDIPNHAPAEPPPIPPQDYHATAQRARESFLSDKPLAKSGPNKGHHTKDNQKAADIAAFNAVAEQHGETVPHNFEGMRQRVDGFGKKTVSGKIDPLRPFDRWLIDQAKQAGTLSDESLKTLLALQDAIGTTVSYDYGHAAVTPEGDMPTRTGRAGAQAQHSVAKRLSGESAAQTERKTSIPLGIHFNSGTKSFTVYGASPEKLLGNFNHIAERMADAGETIPYRDINDPQFVADFKGVIRNHENGWQGDGSRPAVGTEEFPNFANPQWKNSPERATIPADRFEFINMMLGDEGAKSARPEGKAKAHLANENRRLVNEFGETNETRQRLNDSATPQTDAKGNPISWSKATLEDPLNENISPALASNIGEASQSDASIRVHGKADDVGQFFPKGKRPDSAKSAAGFLPEDPTAPVGPREAARKRIEERSQARAAFLPEEKKTPKEMAQERIEKRAGKKITSIGEESNTAAITDLENKYGEVETKPISINKLHIVTDSESGRDAIDLAKKEIQDGKHYPLVAEPIRSGKQTGKFRITDGNHRAAGYRELGIDPPEVIIPKGSDKSAKFLPESKDDARKIVPAIKINGNLVEGRTGDTHRAILNRWKEGRADDEKALAEMDFDTKENPNFFRAGDQEISRDELKTKYGVSDSQGLRRLQGGEGKFLPEQDTNEHGLYSVLHRTIADKMPNSAPAAQVLAIARQGTKPEELKWSDLDNAVKRIADQNGGKVPKQALLDYLKTDGAVRFKEVNLSDDRTPLTPQESKEREGLSQSRAYGEVSPEKMERLAELNHRKLASEGDYPPLKPTKFSQYTLPGGKNYREVVLTIPKKEVGLSKTEQEELNELNRIVQLRRRTPSYPWGPDQADRLSELKRKSTDANISANFTSSHYPDAGNYVAHMRIADHTDAQGKEGTLIEELQSDRHQQGREKGYSDDALTAIQNPKKPGPNTWKVSDPKGTEIGNFAGDTAEEAISYAQKQRIAPAPLAKTWQEYQFRRALAEAVSGGKEWIGWTTGETQGARYDLSKHLNGLSITKNTDGEFNVAAWDKNDNSVIKKSGLTQQELADTIGKEFAQKAEAQETNESVKYEGLDLKVGGEGMKGFYDNIMPKYVQNYVKKWGATVEKGELPGQKAKSGNDLLESANVTRQQWNAMTPAERKEITAKFNATTPIWQVAITPEMRAGVKAGQALFLPEDPAAGKQNPREAAQQRQRPRQQASVVRLAAQDRQKRRKELQPN